MVSQNCFISAIANSGVENVRPVLEYYSQFDDPLEVFKENQIKLKVRIYTCFHRRARSKLM